MIKMKSVDQHPAHKPCHDDKKLCLSWSALGTMVPRFSILTLGCLLSFSHLLTAAAMGKLAGRRPNIIFLITDDQGYGDISAHGNPVLKTPHFDRLRAEGAHFEDWHNSPTCAPTRSALLTGRHEFRNGVTHTIFERERLDPKATTIAQVLKESGYRTGIFGKWHLGDEPDYRPDRRGFEEVFIHGGGGIGQSFPGSCGDAPGNRYFDPFILHNGSFVKTKGYCTDVFFKQATAWIEQCEAQEAPFFCWIATNAPHLPHMVREEDHALYKGKGLEAETEKFFGMIHNIDENLGKLMARLDAWGIADDTLIIAMNDNGGTAGTKVFNAGMRGSKGSPWLGGTRAFSFWRWKGSIRPGERNQLTAHLDFFKTAADLAGAKLSPALLAQSAEGRSLLPLLENPEASWPDRFLFSHLGRWPKGSNPDDAKLKQAAIRNNRFALVNEANHIKGWQLFDLSKDPSQRQNIAVKHPAQVEEMMRHYDQWWVSLKGQYDIHERASGPKLNPFASDYWKQFGGGPSPSDIKRMNPARAFEAAKKPPKTSRPQPGVQRHGN
jgi:arylsulfatase A-like enzyme